MSPSQPGDEHPPLLTLTLRGEQVPPLTPAAHQRREPEPFLGEEVQTAVGKTGPDGSAEVSIPKENRSAPDAPPGVNFGLYKVRISKDDGGERVPAKFNSATTLGQEVAFDDPVVKQGIVLKLSSR